VSEEWRLGPDDLGGWTLTLSDGEVTGVCEWASFRLSSDGFYPDAVVVPVAVLREALRLLAS